MLNKSRQYLISTIGLVVMGGAGTPALAQMAGDIQYSSYTSAPMTSGYYAPPSQGAAQLSVDATETYSIDLNKTRVMHLNEPASAVIVGNPAIADVSVHSDNTVFIIGRGYGETNVLILNQNGDVVVNRNVQVKNTLPAYGVRVYNGGAVNRNTYNCTPYCQPAPVLGDEGVFKTNNEGTVEQIVNQTATSSSNGSFASFGGQASSLTTDVASSDPGSGMSDFGSSPF